jgi:hypothetical protein
LAEVVGTSKRSKTSGELVMEPTMEAGVETGSGAKLLGAVVQIDDGKIRAHLDAVVRAHTADLETPPGKEGISSVLGKLTISVHVLGVLTVLRRNLLGHCVCAAGFSGAMRTT